MAFKLGPVQDAENRLKRDFIDFARMWADAKEQWLDDRCRSFEQEHLSSLGPSLNRFSAALNEFCDVIRRSDDTLRDDNPPGGTFD
ncbi:hypothetical protein [Novipirellula artificiosorum]|uniref:Uncharacterized protein n=1 Tax=Novipirellula artificiosorum TaxID=2528016 RepID=A0A5C6DH51_9BACT|nr:hypothetical protein [Novipirellula artificiosorum]TWU35167.1 hypothetical protein Poly41_43160 [Novipirellula artificiosorum]